MRQTIDIIRGTSKTVNIAVSNANGTPYQLRSSEKLRFCVKRGYEDDVCVIETGTQIMNGYGAIYVPADLVDTYKSASNWSTFADKIYPISEYPKVDYGTITDS